MNLRRRIDKAAAAADLAGAGSARACACRPGGWASVDLTGDGLTHAAAYDAAGVALLEPGAAACARCGGILAGLLTLEYDAGAPQDGEL